MPITSNRRSGTRRANSTAAAPRSRCFCRSMSLPSDGRVASCETRCDSGGDCRTGSALVGSVDGRDLALDALEQALELGAESCDGHDDGDGDQADHEAVLDGGGAAVLLALEAALDDVEHGEQVSGCAVHVDLPRLSAPVPPDRDCGESA